MASSPISRMFTTLTPTTAYEYVSYNRTAFIFINFITYLISSDCLSIDDFVQ